MPYVSQHQAGFFGEASTPEGRAKLIREGRHVPSMAVVREFQKASKGMKLSDLPNRKGPAHQTGVHAVG